MTRVKNRKIIFFTICSINIVSKCIRTKVSKELTRKKLIDRVSHVGVFTFLVQDLTKKIANTFVMINHVKYYWITMIQLLNKCYWLNSIAYIIWFQTKHGLNFKSYAYNLHWTKIVFLVILINSFLFFTLLVPT